MSTDELWSWEALAIGERAVDRGKSEGLPGGAVDRGELEGVPMGAIHGTGGASWSFSCVILVKNAI